MHLPDIDANQFLIRNGRIIERDRNARPRTADAHIAHEKAPSWIGKMIGALRLGLFLSSISTFTIAVSALPGRFVTKCVAQELVNANRHRHHGSNRPSPQSRKRDYKRETCAPHFGEEAHLTGRHLVAQLHSEFGIGSYSVFPPR